MKAIIVTVLFLALLSTEVLAIQWKNVESVVVTWEAPTVQQTPKGSKIMYRVYLSDPLKFSIILLGVTEQNNYEVVLRKEGEYLIGVSTIIVDSEGFEIKESPINWSNEDEVNPFGLSYHVEVPMPESLKP